MSIARTLRRITVAVALLLPSAAAAQPITDGEFVGWTFLGGAVSFVREASGGNPGARLTVATSAPSGSVIGAAINGNTLVSGPLAGAGFQLAIDFLSGPGALGQGQGISFALRQGENVYVRNLNPGATGLSNDWTTLSFAPGSFVAAEWTRIAGAGPALPDFSGAVATAFGFSVSNSFSSITNHYDNFRLTLTGLTPPPPTVVPEPSTWVLTAAGLLGVAAARRRRRTRATR